VAFLRRDMQWREAVNRADIDRRAGTQQGLDRLARWWPLLLIGVGAWFLYGSFQKRKAGESADDSPLV